MFNIKNLFTIKNRLTQMKTQICAKKRIFKFNFVLILLISLYFVPFLTLAAGIYFGIPTEKIYQGDIFMIKVRISNPDKLVNAIEGHLIFDKNKLEVKEITTNDSLLNIWAKYPSFSNTDGKIDFIGGNPKGFQEEDGSILNIFFLAKEKGIAKLDFQDNTLMFLADGKGTSINPWLKSLTLNILEKPKEISSKNELQTFIEKDKTPPEPFEITLGKDPSIFNNQYFISFAAVDKESGIDHYEVLEAPYKVFSMKYSEFRGEWERGESPYVLKDQTLKSIIIVKAVDKAGNERIEEYLPSGKLFPYLKLIKIILILIAIGAVWWIIRSRRTRITSGKTQK